MTNEFSESIGIGMRLIANELIILQALAADAPFSTTTQDSTATNTSFPGLHVFEPKDIALFYHHQPGERSHKLSINL